MNDDAPLLTYVFSTTPNPLQSARRGAITVIASNPDPANPIVCHKISLTLSVGRNAADLTADTSGIATPSPAGFKAECVGSIYSATATSPQGASVVNSVLLKLESIAINDQNGATTIYIDEEAAYGAQPPKLRSSTFQLAKLPPEFELSDLSAAPDTVESGNSVVLNWRGTKLPDLVTYKLSWIAGTVRQERTVDAEGPLRIDNVDTEPQTNFNLVAHVAAAEPVTRTRSVNVTPRAPVIDSFTGTIVGNKIKLGWSAKFATSCTIDSQQYNPSGETLLPIDRICYVLTAKNSARSTNAVVVLKFTNTNTRWPDGQIWHNFLASGDKLVAASNGVGCVLMDATSLATQKVLVAPPQGSTYVEAVAAVNGDGSRIFGAMSAYEKGNAATLFDQRGEKIATVDPGWVELAIFSPAGESLYVITGSKPLATFKVHRYSATTLQKKSDKEFEGDVFGGAVCMSPGGDRLFIGSFVSVWAIDVESGNVTSGEISGRDGIRTLNCWTEGNDLRVLAGTDNAGVVLDGMTLKKVRDVPFRPLLMAGTVLIASAWSGTNVLDRSSFKPLAKLPMTVTASFGSGLAFAGGVLYVTQYGAITRWMPTGAERVTPQAFEVLASEGAVVVLVSKNEPVTFVIDGEDVVAEAPPGWSVTREGNAFSFEPLDATSGVHPFVFRNVEGEAIQLTEQLTARTLRLGPH